MKVTKIRPDNSIIYIFDPDTDEDGPAYEPGILSKSTKSTIYIGTMNSLDGDTGLIIEGELKEDEAVYKCDHYIFSSSGRLIIETVDGTKIAELRKKAGNRCVRVTANDTREPSLIGILSL